jgi:hypothetical protein
MTNAPGQMPTKKKTSGCLIAILAVGGGGLLIAMAVVIFAVRWMRSPEGQRITAAVGETAKVMQEAAAAPGTEELRGLGCKQAFVIDMDRMQSIFAGFDDARAAQPNVKTAVMCQVSPSTSLGCDEIAATYTSAVPSRPGPFMAQVQATGGRVVCQKTFEADGAPMP